jgi:hypothetical protein
MNVIETGQVLAKIQAFDNRTVDDATTIAWQEVFEPHTVHDALTAVSDYFRTNSAWIMPSHIIERVRAMEENRANQFRDGYHLSPADEERIMLSGDTSAWSNGMRALHRAVRTGVLTPDAYTAYQDGTKSIEAILTRKAIK